MRILVKLVLHRLLRHAPSTFARCSIARFHYVDIRINTIHRVVGIKISFHPKGVVLDERAHERIESLALEHFVSFGVSHFCNVMRFPTRARRIRTRLARLPHVSGTDTRRAQPNLHGGMLCTRRGLTIDRRRLRPRRHRNQYGACGNQYAASDECCRRGIGERERRRA